MKTISSHKFTSIAAVAAALFTSGSIARAGEVFRANLYVAPRAPIVAPIAVRPVHVIAQFPVRPVVIAAGPAYCPAPVYAYPIPRPIAPVTVGVAVREGWVGHSYGWWGRR